MRGVTQPTFPAGSRAEMSDAAGRAGQALRAGVIGTGFMGEVHARAIRSAGATVSAVAGSTPQRAVEALNRLGARSAAGSPLDLVARDDVDVVHICAPNHLHP